MKEKKLALRASGLAVRILDAVGEFDDYLEAFYNALPKDRRSRSHSMYQRARQVYTYSHELDAEILFHNLVYNEVEDRFFGEIGNQAKKASQTFGTSAGIQLGKVF